MTDRPPVLANAERRGGLVRLCWSDGVQADFAAAWLLDNAPAARRSPNGQRETTAERLAAALPLAAFEVSRGDLVMRAPPEPTAWPGALLRTWTERADADRGARMDLAPQLWPEGSILVERPVVPFPSYMSQDAALRAVLAEVARFGLARLEGAGAETGALERVVRRFGYVRETNYGRLFEVRVVTDPDNLANSARALEAHTDNPYRDPVPTLQLLHCIRNDGDGAATVFLDGFALAGWLRRDWPADFDRLARQPVTFAYTTGDGARYEARSPVIRLSPEGEVDGLRLNHRALGALDLDAATAAAWYEAYLRLTREAEAQERRLRIALTPGDIVIFDNERILHGREAIGGSVDRLLMGCYADRDGLRATLARLGR